MKKLRESTEREREREEEKEKENEKGERERELSAVERRLLEDAFIVSVNGIASGMKNSG
eukprot:CAMPEP_0182422842 /NCGR_PEP_ID=MMETSP1167-20130531/8658_1 /TAXON_ID=2988 /ORGANISM="Mallomonas Sp, Strain CCMP3275" /LENGTH=58 /DNA_ID=CAMNT_0024601257 /DNA_START=209 /DNA_END=385 /DNA_ORIENTATION=+